MQAEQTMIQDDPTTTMTKAKARSRRGRPKGAKTKERDHVRHVPARCPKCRSTDLVKQRHVCTTAYAGKTPDGQPFTAIERHRAVCRSCGQHLMLSVHQFRPEVRAKNEETQFPF